MKIIFQKNKLFSIIRASPTQKAKLKSQIDKIAF